MNNSVSFKTRVKDIAITKSKIYSSEFINKEYLIYSNDFLWNKQYILSSTTANYMHLLGINTSLKPDDFFYKCINGTLTEDDFDFSKPNRNEKEVKGSVRRKIVALEEMDRLIQVGSRVEEKFVKNKISCEIAAANSKATLGFSGVGKYRPKSLMKGYELSAFAIEPDLILAKNKDDISFNTIIIGDLDVIKKYCSLVDNHALIHENLIFGENNKMYQDKITSV